MTITNDFVTLPLRDLEELIELIGDMNAEIDGEAVMPELAKRIDRQIEEYKKQEATK